jgi:hypothetical protein
MKAPGWFVVFALQHTQKPTNEPTIQLTNSRMSCITRSVHRAHYRSICRA